MSRYSTNREPVADAELLVWHCPLCDLNPQREVLADCMACHGTGFTDQAGIAGFEAHARPAPRPPAVRPGPCLDCACRAGSPEQEQDYDLASVLDRSKPFFCHENMPVVHGEYQPVAWAGGMPLGYLVCGGWWHWATTGKLPWAPYRETSH